MSLQALIDGGLPANGLRRLAATDIAGYLRLDQCERYLRLQMQMRNLGNDFLAEFDVAPQPLPALLTGSGADFERNVIAQVRERMPLTDFTHDHRKANDNPQVIDAIWRLEPGAAIALSQPRMHVPVDGWDLRGDIDLLILSRDESGSLSALVLDMKSSNASRIEHRVQTAIYAVMVRQLCEMNGIEPPSTRIGIVYRGASDPNSLTDEERERQELHRAAAAEMGLDGALLDLSGGDVLYQDAVDDLVLGQRSVARIVAGKPLGETAFFFAAKCDGCFFNEFCLKSAHEQDDLSLIPFMGLDTKLALQRSGINTTSDLAALKAPATMHVAGIERRVLAPLAGKERICHDLGDHRAVAGRLDELVARARKYRKLSEARFEERNDLSGAGYGTLPYCDAEHDPNLVRVFLDVQRDYLTERLYLASALVQASANGVIDPDRRRAIVTMAEEPPETAEAERRVLVRFTGEVLRAVIELAGPDEDGELRAPIHLIFYERGAMKALLEALGRQADAVLGATSLYDFITQLAAFDSPLVTILSDEIRALKNYPILAPSLQAVARYLGFDWDEERPLTTLFRSQLFDDVRPVDEDGEAWFTGRSRFSSNIPLEYAYNSWGKLPSPKEDSVSDRASYRTVERGDLLAFAKRRLEAMETITADFRGNDRTFKSRFVLPEIGLFEPRPPSIAAGLDEFTLTEQHVSLSGWKAARQPAPEQRMLNGASLIVRYLESDQEPGVPEANREHAVRAERYEVLRAAFLAENPDAEKVQLSKEDRAQTKWDHTGMEFRFEILHPGGNDRIERLLGLSDIRVGDRVIIAERWSVDSRLPVEERVSFQTTPKQLLYGDRADVVGIERETNADGEVNRTLVRLRMAFNYSGEPGFVFRGRTRIFEEGTVYTLETDPNNIMLSRGRKLAKAIEEGAVNALTERLALEGEPVNWPSEAAAGQARFLEGMNAFTREGALHEFEPQKHRYIGSLGDAPTLLVQGPPGTGKSYTTAFAIWARVQGALAAAIPYRVLISCKTHAATDVLLKNVAEVQNDLKRFRQRMPELFNDFFDSRLLDVPVYRYQGKAEPGYGISPIFGKDHPAMDGRKAADLLARREQVIAGMTPGGMWKLVSERWKDLFANRFINLLVLDEASQMNLPEAVMSALPLELDGQLIVVGDHRQMPPIVQHDWAKEARRAFKVFAAYESLYLALDRIVPNEHKIKFAESFRLHRDMAEFLKREIYHQDGINFFSRKVAHLQEPPNGDAFADSVLGPEPLVVIAHDEMASQTSNAFEKLLIERLVKDLDGFEPTKGLGVVVPHRSQRASLQEAIEALSIRDEATGAITLSAVDTVERFQGDERRVIVVSLTESDPHFIRTTSEFLLDPRRLTVALSRAKEKMIVIASRSVFGVIAGDVETFANAGLWKNLIRRTCTETRWIGTIENYDVEVRVNPPLVD